MSAEHMDLPLKVGQRWAHPRPGPWGGTYDPVEIIDVREGWVRYSHVSDHGLLGDLRDPELEFRSFYSEQVVAPTTIRAA